MSLDVYLELQQPASKLGGSGIFIRVNGAIQEITREEWDRRFPGCEPVISPPQDDEPEVYRRNITHNLGRMAEAAGVYKAMWRPDEIGATKAVDLIDPLTEGLERLRAEPAKYRAHNPSNGWGDYDGLVAFVADYLSACRRYPDATVRVSR